MVVGWRTIVAGATLAKAEQKTAAGGPDAAQRAVPRSHVGGRRTLRILIFLLYAAAGWGLLALLWFGLIA